MEKHVLGDDPISLWSYLSIIGFKGLKYFLNSIK